MIKYNHILSSGPSALLFLSFSARVFWRIEQALNDFFNHHHKFVSFVNYLSYL